jgi:DNA-binding NtrC family response regulator
MTQSVTQPAWSSTTMHEIREELDCAIRSDARVLITGEDSAEREAIARLIHQRSLRSSGAFAAVDCSAPDPVVQGDLFGDRGLLHQALAGTLFIDRISDMSERAQAELVTFLDAAADVRIVAATDRSLYEDMLAGRFREDLYYRLNIIHIVCSRSTIAPSTELSKIRQSPVAAERRAIGEAV